MIKKPDWKKFFLFLLLNCLLITGLIAISFKKPQFVKLNKVEFVDVRDSLFNFRINMTVSNPNFFSMSGKDIEISLSEAGQQYGTGSIDPFSLRREGKSDLILYMSLNYKQFIQSYNSNTSDTLVPAALITGTFMPGFFLHEINLKKKVPKKAIFSLLGSAFSGENVIRADSFSLKKINAFESRIDFTIAITNNFNFDFSIEEINADVNPSKDKSQALGNVLLQRTITLPSKAKVSVPLELTVKNLSLLMALVRLGRKDLDSFYLDGEAVVNIKGESIRIPIDIPLTKQASSL